MWSHFQGFMWGVIILDYAFLKETINIFIEKTSFLRCISHMFRIAGLNRPWKELLNTVRKPFEVCLYQSSIARFVRRTEYEIYSVEFSILPNGPRQILKTMRMMRPCVVKEELLGNTITSPFSLDSQVRM